MRLPKNIETIAPLWSGRIKEENVNELQYETKKIGDKTLYLGEYPTCVVGEAWLFKGKYIDDCTDCSEFSMEIWRGLSYREPQRFRKGLKEFGEHFKKEHPKLFKKHEEKGNKK